MVQLQNSNSRRTFGVREWRALIYKSIETNDIEELIGRVYDENMNNDYYGEFRVPYYVSEWVSVFKESPSNLLKCVEINKRCCDADRHFFFIWYMYDFYWAKKIKREIMRHFISCIYNIYFGVKELEKCLRNLEDILEYLNGCAPRDRHVTRAIRNLKFRKKTENEYKKIWYKCAHEGNTTDISNDATDYNFSAMATVAEENIEFEQHQRLFSAFLSWVTSEKAKHLSDNVKEALRARLQKYIAGTTVVEVKMRILLDMEENAMEQEYTFQMASFDLKDLEEKGKLGEGGQAKVMLMKSKMYPEDIVVKFFQKYSGNMYTLDIKSLLKEIKCLAIGNHPHIITIFGVVYDTIPVGIALEHCEDGNLESVINAIEKFKYETDQVVKWSLQAASALIFLHKKESIHRDIKPANMFLKNRRTLLKIGDMGMSKLGAVNWKGHPTPCGTSLYAPPELQNSDINSRICTPKGDVFSL